MPMIGQAGRQHIRNALAQPTSNALGFMQQLSPALENFAQIGTPLDYVPGLDSRPYARTTADHLDAHLARRIANGEVPGTLGAFLGAVLAQEVPGGAPVVRPQPATQAAPADPDGFVWSLIRKAAPGVGANPFPAPGSAANGDKWFGFGR